LLHPYEWVDGNRVACKAILHDDDDRSALDLEPSGEPTPLRVLRKEFAISGHHPTVRRPHQRHAVRANLGNGAADRDRAATGFVASTVRRLFELEALLETQRPRLIPFREGAAMVNDAAVLGSKLRGERHAPRTAAADAGESELDGPRSGGAFRLNDH